jgi:tRNA nucleotidyltransferase (CCA-adding enzyme)
MADYIYLLGTRLTRAQQAALEAVREVARAHSLTVFLVGGAVRDLTSGAPVRDIDVAVQGNALTLQKELEAKGGLTLGSYPVMQTLHMFFPGGVRLGVESTLSVTYPKPGKAVTAPATILDDLRRRDFTANAMAVSLNEGSYGLLMDPLNGVADIENRELRLVSNYGFIEDPARMLRGIRLATRFGWQFEEKTRQRYENGKAEEYLAAMQADSRGYELEDIFHEEEPLRVLRRFEEEGWSKLLFPALQSTKANEAELERLRDLVDQMQTMGIYPDASAANFPLLTAKMAPKDVAELKKSFARPGFAMQIDALEASTKEFAAQFTARTMTAPSDIWKLLLSAPPEQVLSLAFSSKNATVQSRFKAFFEEWPNARQRIPYAIMQEMRITPDLPGYNDLLESLFFALMDGKLETPEAIREFLEPYSPPAPPVPVTVRRRAAKRETKSSKGKAKPAAAASTANAEGEQIAANEATETPSPAPAVAAEQREPAKKAPANKSEPAAAPKPANKQAAAPPVAAVKTKAAPEKPAPGKAAPKSAAKPQAKAPVKKVVAKAAVKKTVAKKTMPAKKSVPAKRTAPAKAAVKKAVAKTPAKKKASPPAKKTATKQAPKKAAKKSRR